MNLFFGMVNLNLGCHNSLLDFLACWWYLSSAGIAWLDLYVGLGNFTGILYMNTFVNLLTQVHIFFIGK